MADRDGGPGMGLIAGVILAVLVIGALLIFAGPFDWRAGKDVNVKIETPKTGAPAKPGG